MLSTSLLLDQSTNTVVCGLRAKFSRVSSPDVIETLAGRAAIFG